MTSGENTNSDKGNTDVWTRIESTLDRIVQMQETSRQIAEMNNGGIDWDRLEQMQEENARVISELGKNIGGLHNKFGDFTEDLAIASIERILEEDFEVDYAGYLTAGHLKEVGRLQVEVYGVAQYGERAAYLVEIKSKFEMKHIEQVRKFRKYYPNFDSWGVYPVIASVQITKEQRAKVWESGVYLI